MKFDFIKIYCKLLEDKREYLITIELKDTKYIIEFMTKHVDSKVTIGSFRDPLTAFNVFFRTSKFNIETRNKEEVDLFTINRNVNSMSSLLHIFERIIYWLDGEDRLSDEIKINLIKDLRYSGFQVGNKRYKLEDHWNNNTLSFIYNFIEITDKKK